MKKNLITLFILAITACNSNSMIQENQNSEGGKFFGRGGNNTELYGGNPFVYSNNGEVELIEFLFKSASNLDAEAVSSVVADSLWFRSQDGSQTYILKEDIPSIFEQRKSQEMNIWAILPNKIKGRPGGSATTVSSYVKIEFINGEVFEKELMELYYIENDIINGIEQWSRDISSNTN